MSWEATTERPVSEYAERSRNAFGVSMGQVRGGGRLQVVSMLATESFAEMMTFSVSKPERFAELERSHPRMVTAFRQVLGRLETGPLPTRDQILLSALKRATTQVGAWLIVQEFDAAGGLISETWAQRVKEPEEKRDAVTWPNEAAEGPKIAGGTESIRVATVDANGAGTSEMFFPPKNGGG